MVIATHVMEIPHIRSKKSVGINGIYIYITNDVAYMNTVYSIHPLIYNIFIHFWYSLNAIYK